MKRRPHGWTDLDEQIAKLKGWRWSEDLHGWLYSEECTMTHGPFVVGLRWATSEDEAWGLVDELADPLFFIERYGKPGQKRWKAHFAFGRRLTWFDESRNATISVPDAPFDAYGEGATRPEAICRAYIAAREYISKHGR